MMEKLILSAISVVVIAVTLLHSNTLAYPKLARPKIYGTAIPPQELDPIYNATQRKILMIHNFFRTRVKPIAADMLQMTWHDGAAEDAQRWAESCQVLLHDNVTGRWTDDHGTCGQNIFVANVQVPWFFAAKVWFLERLNFTYGEDKNDPNVVGHYTQGSMTYVFVPNPEFLRLMFLHWACVWTLPNVSVSAFRAFFYHVSFGREEMVWYSTHRVGCGFSYCEASNATGAPYYSYVCNYCPIGNHPERFDRPYTNGTACSGCQGHCKFNSLCTNGCPYADYWTNCIELNSTWHNWLCDDHSTDRYLACRATCDCAGSIR